jgi:hypothetical protein
MPQISQNEPVLTIGFGTEMTGGKHFLNHEQISQRQEQLREKVIE